MIVLEKEAMEELREIGRWYALHRPHVADRYFEDFRNTLRRVEQTPEAFPRMHGAPLVRRARFGRYPYRIVYLVATTGMVHVLAIPHDKRRPLYWKGRLRRLT
jgi:plasmid stabilization system protein ParE